MTREVAPPEEAIAKLAEAAMTRRRTSAKPWHYGWAFADYRRSTNAAMSHNADSAVRLSGNGVADFESGVTELVRGPAIQPLYDSEEFWSIVVSAIASLPLNADPVTIHAEVRKRVGRLLKPPPSLVVFPVANCKCVTPIQIATCLLAAASRDWRAKLRHASGINLAIEPSTAPWWADSLAASNLAALEKASLPTVLFARWGPEQQQRAIDLAEEAFGDLVALALVLEPDLDRQKLYSLRGDVNKPGIRGLQEDRGALEQAARSVPTLKSELGAAILVTGLFEQHLSHHWYSHDPFPIDSLLASKYRRSSVARVLTPRNAVQHRLRTAARWHAKAHWAEAPDDAVLALGIAFDALLSESGPSPSRVLSERYALLESEKALRPEAYRHFSKDIYPARSAVAHGGKTSTSINGKFVRGMAAELRVTFSRIDKLTVQRSAVSEQDYGAMFDDLKWGG